MQPSPSRIDFNELINACIERVLWIFSILRNLIVQWKIIVSHTSFATYTRVNFHFSIIQSLYYSYLNISFIFPSIYQRVFRIVLLHKVYKKNKYNVQNYVSRVYLLIHTLASILNFNAIKILEFMYLWLFRFYRFSAILVKILIHKLNLVNL